jgi:hypothetical protein
MHLSNPIDFTAQRTDLNKCKLKKMVLEVRVTLELKVDWSKII